MQIRRLLLWVVGALIPLGLLALILWPTDSSPPPRLAAAQNGAPLQYSLKLGYNMPETSVMHAAAERLAADVALKSDGRLNIELFPDQALGNDHQMLELARSGELDMILTPTAKLSIAIPEMQYADLPFYFPSQDDVYELLDGQPGEMLLHKLSRIGLVGVAYWGNGFKQFTANKPLLEPDQFAGQRFRIMKSRLLKEQFELMGAEAIPIDFHHVKHALKDGVVDGQENPLAAIVAMGIHEEQRNLTLSSHAYLAYVLSINQQSFKSLPVPLQSLLISSARTQTQWQRQETERREKALLEQIADSGVQVDVLSDEQKQVFRERFRPLVERFETVIGADLIALSDQLLTNKYASDDNWLIGLDLDLTPVHADVGIDIKRGVELALASVPGFGVLALDNSGQPSRAKRNMQEFVDDPRVIAAVGGICADVLTEQLPIIDRSGMPMLLPWIANAALFDSEQHPTLFSVGFSSGRVVDQVASIAADREAGSVSIITQNSSWGNETIAQLKQKLAEHGLEFAGAIQLRVGESRVDTGGLKDLMSRSDFVLVSLHRRAQGPVYEQIAALDAQPQLVSVWEEVAPTGLRLECLYTTRDDDEYEQLRKRYISRYRVEPKVPSALIQGYDSALFISSALAQLEQKGIALSRENLARELESLPPVRGIVKTYMRAFKPGDHQALLTSDYAVSAQACVPGSEADL